MAQPWLDPAEIRKAVAVLVEPGAVFECRVLGGRKRVNDDWRGEFYGYFDNAAALVAALEALRGGWHGAYITPNPCMTELLARVAGRLERAPRDGLTKDGEILRRRWLLIDVDAQRVKGIAATDAELAAAKLKARAVAAALGKAGFGEPVKAESGNGAHLLYRVDLPAKDETVPRVLKALAAQFSDAEGESKHLAPGGAPRVCIDTSVGNPARIWKLYGTLAAKGESTAERPHRMARLVSVPDRLEPVPVAVLAAFAPEPAPAVPGERRAKRTATSAPTGPFDAVAFVESHGFECKTPKRLDGGGVLRELRSCPCDRQESKSFLTIAASGAVGLACQNASCAYSRGNGTPGDHWRTFRSERDPGYAAELDGERERERDEVAAWHRDVWARRHVRPLPPMPSLRPAPARPATAPPVLPAGIDGSAFVDAPTGTPAPLPEIDATEIAWPVADKKGKPRNGYLENTQALLAAYEVEVKHNLMAHEAEIVSSRWRVPGETARNYGFASVRVAAERHGLSKESVTEHLIVLAEPYHPVRDWFATIVHDGRDRVDELFATITLQADADVELCRLLFGLWLRQCAAAAILPDGQFRASGVLVAQGTQNRGKTRWLESLAPPAMRAAWVATGVALDPHDRDSIQQLTSYWLAELGEIESTFRRDVAMLKAMITRPFDVYRQAYARSAERVPRRTVFYGSVNRPDYLIDDTGNRRFWTLPVLSMDADHSVDIAQLWAQVAAEVLRGERYWLTVAESEHLESRNVHFRAVDPLGAELWATWAAVPVESLDADAGAGRTLGEIWAAMPSGAGGRVPDRLVATRLTTLLADCRRKQVRNGNATFRVKLIAPEPERRNTYGGSGRYGD